MSTFNNNTTTSDKGKGKSAALETTADARRPTGGQLNTQPRETLDQAISRNYAALGLVSHAEDSLGRKNVKSAMEAAFKLRGEPLPMYQVEDLDLTCVHGPSPGIPEEARLVAESWGLQIKLPTSPWQQLATPAEHSQRHPRPPTISYGGPIRPPRGPQDYRPVVPPTILLDGHPILDNPGHDSVSTNPTPVAATGRPRVALPVFESREARVAARKKAFAAFMSVARKFPRPANGEDAAGPGPATQAYRDSSNAHVPVAPLPLSNDNVEAEKLDGAKKSEEVEEEMGWEQEEDKLAAAENAEDVSASPTVATAQKGAGAASTTTPASSFSRAKLAAGSSNNTKLVQVGDSSKPANRFQQLPRVVESVVHPPPAPATEPSDLRDLRVIFLVGIPETSTLQGISASVASGLYGAVYSIKFGRDEETGERLVGVIFRDTTWLHSADGNVSYNNGGAAGYFMALKAAAALPWAERNKELWPFPEEATIGIYCQAFAANDLLRRMHVDKANGVSALTRRLSLIGPSGFFKDAWNPASIMQFCMNAGIARQDIQILCVHNFGNATMIFSDVESAVTARARILEHVKTSRRRRDMEVTHSRCPCEKKLSFFQDRAWMNWARKNPKLSLLA